MGEINLRWLGTNGFEPMHPAKDFVWMAWYDFRWICYPRLGVFFFKYLFGICMQLSLPTNCPSNIFVSLSTSKKTSAITLTFTTLLLILRIVSKTAFNLPYNRQQQMKHRRRQVRWTFYLILPEYREYAGPQRKCAHCIYGTFYPICFEIESIKLNFISELILLTFWFNFTSIKW